MASGVSDALPPSKSCTRGLLLTAADEHRPPSSFDSTSIQGRVTKWLSIEGRRQSGFHDRVAALKNELVYAELRAAYATHIVMANRFSCRSIARMPNELWRYIFEMVVRSASFVGSGPSMYNLMLVCSSWKQILTGPVSAYLWNPIDFRGARFRKQSALLSQLGYFRQTASDSPNILPLVQVMVSLEDIRVDSLRAILAGSSISSFILHHFYAASGHTARSLLSVTVELPVIETLCIEGASVCRDSFPCLATEDKDLPAWARESQADRRHISWSFADDGASLTSAALLWTASPETEIALPWQNIRNYAELNTARIGGGIPSYHLVRMSQLTTLTLGGVFLPRSGPYISLPALREFNYTISWVIIPSGEHFGGVSLPGLQIWRVAGDHESMRNAVEASDVLHHSLRQFLPQCPLLQTLVLSLQFPYDGNTLIDHMRVCPALLHVDIRTAHATILDYTFVRGLADMTVAPSLRTFIMAESTGYGSQQHRVTSPDAVALAEATVDMLEARFAGGLCLMDLSEHASRNQDVSETGHPVWEKMSGWNSDAWGAEDFRLTKDMWVMLDARRARGGWNLLLNPRDR